MSMPNENIEKVEKICEYLLECFTPEEIRNGTKSALTKVEDDKKYEKPWYERPESKDFKDRKERNKEDGGVFALDFDLKRNRLVLWGMPVDLKENTVPDSGEHLMGCGVCKGVKTKAIWLNHFKEKGPSKLCANHPEWREARLAKACEKSEKSKSSTERQQRKSEEDKGKSKAVKAEDDTDLVGEDSDEFKMALVRRSLKEFQSKESPMGEGRRFGKIQRIYKRLLRVEKLTEAEKDHFSQLLQKAEKETEEEADYATMRYIMKELEFEKRFKKLTGGYKIVLNKRFRDQRCRGWTEKDEEMFKRAEADHNNEVDKIVDEVIKQRNRKLEQQEKTEQRKRKLEQQEKTKSKSRKPKKQKK